MKLTKDLLLEKLDKYKKKVEVEKVLTGKMKSRTLATNISVIKAWVKTLPDVIEAVSVEDLLNRYKPKYHKDKIKNFLEYLLSKEEQKKQEEKNLNVKNNSESETLSFDDFENLILSDLDERIKVETINLNVLVGKPATVVLLTGKELKGEIVKLLKGKDYLLVLKQQTIHQTGRYNPRLGSKNVSTRETYKVVPISSVEYVIVPSELFRC